MGIGYLPGEKLGKVLDALMEIVLQNPEENQREQLLELAASWLMGR